MAYKLQPFTKLLGRAIRHWDYELSDWCGGDEEGRTWQIEKVGPGVTDGTVCMQLILFEDRTIMHVREIEIKLPERRKE